MAVPSAHGVAAEDIGARGPSAANTGHNPGSEGARRPVGVTVLDLPNRSLMAATIEPSGVPARSSAGLSNKFCVGTPRLQFGSTRLPPR